jgi:hypothetical protein
MDARERERCSVTRFGSELAPVQSAVSKGACRFGSGIGAPSERRSRSSKELSGAMGRPNPSPWCLRIVPVTPANAHCLPTRSAQWRFEDALTGAGWRAGNGLAPTRAAMLSPRERPFTHGPAGASCPPATKECVQLLPQKGHPARGRGWVAGAGKAVVPTPPRSYALVQWKGPVPRHCVQRCVESEAERKRSALRKRGS